MRELAWGGDSVGVVAARHNLGANMMSGWRKQLFGDASLVFSRERQIEESREAREKPDEEVDNLNRIIGQLAVERDHLQRSLGSKLDELGL